jgi:hypothetical protein
VIGRVSLVLIALAGASCERPCRVIAVTPVVLECEATSTFSGEIHFDDRATFQTFLRSAECLPDAADEDVTAILDSVSFLEDVVFVAVDSRAQLGRGLEQRVADVVEVCEDGLRIAFADKVTAEEACPGKWTVSFALPREEMRAATEDF